MQVVGFLHPTSPHTMRDRLRAFHQGLKETGYVEGENAAIEYRENGVDRIKMQAVVSNLIDRTIEHVPIFDKRA